MTVHALPLRTLDLSPLRSALSGTIEQVAHAYELLHADDVLGRDRAVALNNSLLRLRGLIQLSDRPVASLIGPYSAGKSEILSQHLNIELPSAAKPKTRLFTVIETDAGVEKPHYSIVRLGIAEALRMLRLLEERFHLPPTPGGSVGEVAARLRDAIKGQFDKTAEVTDIFLASYLCTSLERAGITEPTSTERELDAGEFARVIAWPAQLDPEVLGHKPKTLQELDAAVAACFAPDNVGLDPYLPALGAIAFCKVRHPASKALSAGTVWIDSPGLGNNVLDDVRFALVLESSAAAVACCSAMQGGFAGGASTQAVLDRLRAQPLAAFNLTFADDILTKQRAAVERLAGEPDAAGRDSARELLAADHEVWGGLSVLGDADPEPVSRCTMTWNTFADGVAEMQELCRTQAALARYLGEADLDHLPCDLAAEVRGTEGFGRAEDRLSAGLDETTARRTVRLAALTICMAADGGRSRFAKVLAGISAQGEPAWRQAIGAAHRQSMAAFAAAAPWFDEQPSTPELLPIWRRAIQQATRNLKQLRIDAIAEVQSLPIDGFDRALWERVFGHEGRFDIDLRGALQALDQEEGTYEARAHRAFRERIATGSILPDDLALGDIAGGVATKICAALRGVVRPRVEGHASDSSGETAEGDRLTALALADSRLAKLVEDESQDFETGLRDQLHDELRAAVKHAWLEVFSFAPPFPSPGNAPGRKAGRVFDPATHKEHFAVVFREVVARRLGAVTVTAWRACQRSIVGYLRRVLEPFATPDLQVLELATVEQGSDIDPRQIEIEELRRALAPMFAAYADRLQLPEALQF